MKILVFLTALLVVGYLGINFVGLPPLLVAENIALATIYAVLVAALYFRPNAAILALLALVAAFNAGRVSRSVWDPVRGWGMAMEHAPLVVYLIVVSALAIYALAKGKT